MHSTLVPIRISRRKLQYDISVGNGQLSDVGAWAARTVGRNDARLMIVSNRKVFGLYGDRVNTGLSRSGFRVSTHLIGDGERFKNIRTLESILGALSANGLTRTDAVVALGGGVVGDIAGFAAAIHLRGIGFLQIPTTLLAMIDSSVGGKTAVNTKFGKNLVGSFYQPNGVMVDIGTLATLDKREMTAGFCEAVKQGAVAGNPLYRETAKFLSHYDPKNPDLEDRSRADSLVSLISNQIRFKARIVQGDEMEEPSNTASTSRKILNFGHTLAHALEKASGYSYLRHGEAVGYGIMFAAELSKSLELTGQDEVNSLNDVVRRAGSLPAIANIDQTEVLESFQHDKKRIGNSLHWILLKGIGNPVVVPDTEIPRSAIRSTLKTIFQK